MKLLLLTALLFVGCQGAAAQTSECSSVPKASDRLACYDRATPPLSCEACRGQAESRGVQYIPRPGIDRRRARRRKRKTRRKAENDLPRMLSNSHQRPIRRIVELGLKMKGK
jgi:hypothetical protein